MAKPAGHNITLGGALTFVNWQAAAISAAEKGVAREPPVGVPSRRLDSFDRLFEEEWRRVVSVAWRALGDGSAAEDVAQEVFLAFHQRHPNGLPQARAWLHLAAAHLALNRIRSERRRRQREQSAGESVAAPDPVSAVVAAETRREVNAALGRLPRLKASILVLRYAGLSYAEVAAALGIPINQVGRRLRRAEAALLKEMGGEHSRASL